MLRHLGRLRFRLLVVNVVVLLVPISGLEFARTYERQLLRSLERDMKNQAALVRRVVESGAYPDWAVGDPRLGATLAAAATQTRTRVRILDATGRPVGDSHAGGPPEGAEPPPPSLLPTEIYDSTNMRRGRGGGGGRDWSPPTERWPDVPDRREVRSALGGSPDAETRVRDRAPAVLLFVTEPIRLEGHVVGVVYVTRSTQPVLEELYRIRTGLLQILGAALALTLLLTLALAWTISRPLGRLARAARRIARGEPGVKVPVGGGGEIRELGEAVATMTEELDARLRYVRDFAADVTHELKSPLTSIRGAAELLAEGADDDPEARRRFLHNIELDAERLDRLVSRLLELSRIDASVTPMDDVDLDALITRIVDRTHSQEQPVEVLRESGVKRVRGREEDLERALLNLVENALRFSPEGVPVRIRIAGGVRGRPLRITVEDRGPGIPEGDRRRIFERFYTTDGEGSGTGLGLSIVRSVARAHGGSVELAPTRPEGGAAFTLVLPSSHA